jgi:hypothetical protein
LSIVILLGLGGGAESDLEFAIGSSLFEERLSIKKFLWKNFFNSSELLFLNVNFICFLVLYIEHINLPGFQNSK